MDNTQLRSRLLGVTALAAEYCMVVENATESTAKEFVGKMLNILPKLYIEFFDIIPDSAQEDNNDDTDLYVDGYAPLEPVDEDTYYPDYVDEDYYEGVRRHIENLLGPNDTFLETFEEDMKYSDTPIAASISESLADIFQPLYNFISIVKDSEGEHLTGAYIECRENFVSYWAQTLCNVLRALNHIYFNLREDEEEYE